MHIDIHAKDVELNAPLREFIEEKMSDAGRLAEGMGAASVKVEVGIPSQHHHKGEKFYAEANLTVGGHLLRAEAMHHDLHSAIVDVKEELKLQISKLKDRLTERGREAKEE